MKIALVSDIQYRACTPDYENNLSFYGSEPYHAILAKGLAENGHDVHFFAPAGSEPIGVFHPLQCYNGELLANEILEYTSLENLTNEYFINQKFDFFLDFTSMCRIAEEIFNYYGFTNIGIYRNGYAGYDVPRIRMKDRHYIVPSNANKKLYEARGCPDVTTIYYGIPDFYSPGSDSEYNLGLEPRSYFLFPHRPTKEKGTYEVLRLAMEFPNETFVFSESNNPLQEHRYYTSELKQDISRLGLNNIKFLQLPLNPKHHYYKRELLRNAKAVLSPFNPHIYYEGFGLTNAEAVASGTPILVTDSESSRELWIDEKDGLIIPWDANMWGFKQAIKFFDSYSFDPKNKFTVSDYVSNYEKFMNRILMITTKT